MNKIEPAAAKRQDLKRCISNRIKPVIVIPIIASNMTPKFVDRYRISISVIPNATKIRYLLITVVRTMLQVKFLPAVKPIIIQTIPPVANEKIKSSIPTDKGVIRAGLQYSGMKRTAVQAAGEERTADIKIFFLSREKKKKPVKHDPNRTRLHTR